MAKQKKLTDRFTERTDGMPAAKWDCEPDEATADIKEPFEYADHRIRLIIDQTLLNGNLQTAVLACRAFIELHKLGEERENVHPTGRVVNILLGDAKSELKKRLTEELDKN